jgi:hypothetical protein
MLVTLTERLRVHREEVLAVEAADDNTLRLRFVTLKTRRIAVDDLTPEAREWLHPALAPRDIPLDCECETEEYEDEAADCAAGAGTTEGDA